MTKFELSARKNVMLLLSLRAGHSLAYAEGSMKCMQITVDGGDASARCDSGALRLS